MLLQTSGRGGARISVTGLSNALACTRALLVIVIHAHLRRGHVDACDGTRGRYERDEYVLCRRTLEAKPHSHACVTLIVIIRDSLGQHSGHAKKKNVQVQREEQDLRSKT